MQEFLALTGIENADKLLYTDRYPEEKSVITDLKRKYAFRLHIGKRPAVYLLTFPSLPTLDGRGAVGVSPAPAPPLPLPFCILIASLSFWGLECAFMSPKHSAFPDYRR